MGVGYRVQLDGSLPNLALMRLASFHRENGDQVTVTRSMTRELEILIL